MRRSSGAQPTYLIAIIRYMRLKILWLTVLLIAAKVFLAAVTPLGPDFIFIINAVVLSPNDWRSAPLFRVFQGLHGLWLALPVEHPDVVGPLNAPIPYPTAPHFLLTLLVKFPLIALDVGTAFLLYRLALTLTASSQSGMKAGVLWLANPFVTLLTEMWGSADIIVAFFISLALAVHLGRKSRLLALFLGLGVAAKLGPLLAWPAFLLQSGRRARIMIGLAGAVGLLAYFGWSSLTPLDISGSLREASPFTTPFVEFTTSTYLTFVGLGTLAAAAVYLLLGRSLAGGLHSTPGLIMTALLGYFAFAQWFPTQLLWVIPLLTLWWTERGGWRSIAAFHVVMGAWFLTAYGIDLTSISTSVLFVPATLVPYSKTLIQIIRFPSETYLYPLRRMLLRALLSAMLLIVAWTVTLKWTGSRIVESV